jgi:ActR/RegA family two-component response regulator
LAAVPEQAIPTPLPTEHGTPWVLLIMRDPRRLRVVRRLFARAGFGVEVAANVEEAIRLLAVISPAVVIADPPVSLPRPSNLLDRSRTVGVNPASGRDMVREELAEHDQGNRRQLLRKT